MFWDESSFFYSTKLTILVVFSLAVEVGNFEEIIELPLVMDVIASFFFLETVPFLSRSNRAYTCRPPLKQGEDLALVQHEGRHGPPWPWGMPPRGAPPASVGRLLALLGRAPPRDTTGGSTRAIVALTTSSAISTAPGRTSINSWAVRLTASDPSSLDFVPK